MAELDKSIIDEIRQIALTHPEKLMEYINFDKIKQDKICRQKQMGKTLQQIANAMQMPRSTVQDKCKVC
jgi:hypothetical protein